MKQPQQSGFIMMVMIVIMVVGAAAYFGGVGENLFKKNLTTDQLNRMKELQDIKEKLLEFALQHDQIYSTVLKKTPNFYPANQVPGPGYLPCPDNVATELPDGQMSNNCKSGLTTKNGFIHGFLPDEIKGRNFFFTQEFFKPFNTTNMNAKRFYYVVHEQFVVNNPDYSNTINATSTNMNRFAPLNNQFFPDSLTLLSLDGSRHYIALLISPGKPQTFPDGPTQNQSNPAPQNFLDYGVEDPDKSGNLVKINGNVNLDNSVDGQFYNRSRFNNVDGVGVNDVIIGITLQEWQEAVRRRVENQKDWLCNQIDSGAPVWFNAYHPITNPVGGGWREIVC